MPTPAYTPTSGCFETDYITGTQVENKQETSHELFHLTAQRWHCRTIQYSLPLDYVHDCWR